jgi:hypothetical protein
MSVSETGRRVSTALESLPPMRAPHAARPLRARASRRGYRCRARPDGESHQPNAEGSDQAFARGAA